ncbi:MAG: DMT family transporter [Rhodospirillum sp.]|nr:DMT family transporter [Rhodospirillum sp.]MCF8489300.1 DMT family transporter [Rhodospirillum sp.]MCF8500272.1 DMT family transporter [Rhodospirillum sp.]
MPRTETRTQALDRTSLGDRTGLGIVLIVGTVFLMATQDAVVKVASADMPLWQMYALRSLLVLPVLAVPGVLWGRRRGWRVTWKVVVRSLLLAAMYLFLYAAIPLLDLTTIAAAFYTGPLFVTLFSALFLGERVGWRGGAAVCVGFLGALVILRPTPEAFDWLALVPMGAGLCYALAAVLTRARRFDDDALLLALVLHATLATVALTGGLLVHGIGLTGGEDPVLRFLLGPWVPLDSQGWCVLAVLALISLGTGWGLAAAYQMAPPVTVATFDYAYLVFAAGWGVALFGDRPGAWTFFGMGLIAVAGLLILWRERSSPSASLLHPAKSGSDQGDGEPKAVGGLGEGRGEGTKQEGLVRRSNGQGW